MRTMGKNKIFLAIFIELKYVLSGMDGCEIKTKGLNVWQNDTVSPSTPVVFHHNLFDAVWFEFPMEIGTIDL